MNKSQLNILQIPTGTIAFINHHWWYLCGRTTLPFLPLSRKGAHLQAGKKNQCPLKEEG